MNFTVEEKDLVLFTQLDQLRLSLGVNEYTFSESLKQASYTHLALQVRVQACTYVPLLDDLNVSLL